MFDHNATVANLTDDARFLDGFRRLSATSTLNHCNTSTAPAKETKPQAVFMFGLAYLHLFGRDVYDTLVSVVGELNRSFRDHQKLYWRYPDPWLIGR